RIRRLPHVRAGRDGCPGEERRVGGRAGRRIRRVARAGGGRRRPGRAGRRSRAAPRRARAGRAARRRPELGRESVHAVVRAAVAGGVRGHPHRGGADGLPREGGRAGAAPARGAGGVGRGRGERRDRRGGRAAVRDHAGPARGAGRRHHAPRDRRTVLRELLAALDVRGGQVERVREGPDGGGAFDRLGVSVVVGGVPRRLSRGVRDDFVLQGSALVGQRNGDGGAAGRYG